ncbi:phage tail family protein [Arthrobacter sp. HLT1-21]
MAGKTAVLSLKIIGEATGAQRAAADTRGALSGVDQSVDATTKRFGALKLAVAAGLAFAAKKTFDFAKQGVAAFSELEDSTAAAGVVFGDSMQMITDQAATADTKLGLSSQQVIDAANTYGTYGKAAGLAGDDLGKFSTDLTALAGDLASFKGTSTEQSVEAIGAALRGEAEPLRAYGVLLDDATMRQKALELGLVSTTKDALTPQNKILAAQALIFEQTKDAQGDYARTSTSTANVQKTLAAATTNLSAKLGGFLAPAVTAVNLKLLAGVGAISSYLDRLQAGIDLLGTGGLTQDITTALGLDPSQGFGKVVNEAIGGLRAFTAAWKYNDGEITSSGFPGFMEAAAFRIRTAWESLTTFFAGAVQGDFSKLSGVFDAFLAVAKPAGPILIEVGKAVGDMSQTLGELVASALPLAIPLLEGAATGMQFLAENTGALTALIVGLAAAFVIIKAAQTAANLAAALGLPIAVAQAAANFSLAAAIRANTAATGTQIIAERTSILTRLTSTAGLIGHTVASVAARGAQLAAAAAIGVATAAQWLFNAALTANPIGIVIALIAALVAGVILAYNNVDVFRDAVNAAGRVAVMVWQWIVSGAQDAILWINNTLEPIGGIEGALSAFGTVAGIVWSNVTSGISGFVGAIKDAISWVGDLASKIQGLLSGPVDAIKNIAGGLFGLGVQSAAGMPAAPRSGGLFGAGPGEPVPGMFGAGEGDSGGGFGGFGFGGSGSSSAGGMTVRNEYRIEVQAGPGTDRVALGRELVKSIETYERASGRKGRR